MSYFIDFLALNRQHIELIGVNVKSIFATCWQKVIALKTWTFQETVSSTDTQQPSKPTSPMETITAAANVQQQQQLTENNLATYKGHDEDDKSELQSIDDVLDENQENSVDNRQCQSQCARSCRKLSNNKIQTSPTDHQPQPCNCEQNGDLIMANATNGLNHLNVNNQNNTNWTTSTAPTTTETTKTNGFHHRSNKENTLSAKPEEMDVCEYSQQIYGGHLISLADATRDGSLNLMVSSDLSDTELALIDKKCTKEMDASYNSEPPSNDVIDKGHRRTRARSESDQCEFFETRKQQMRLEAPHESDAIEINSDDCLSQSDALDVKLPRRKSLSPPKIGLNRRHITQTSRILRRQKFLQKLRQQGNKSSSPRHSPTTMGKSIPKDIIIIKSTEQPNEKEHASDDSEYSSLEDDDDVQEANESDENDLSDTDESNRCDNKAIYNSYNGSVGDDTNYSMLADSVQGQCVTSGPIAPSLFANVPPYVTFVTHAEKGPTMPAEIKRVLKWKLTTITPIVVRKVVLNSGFRVLKQTNDWMGTWGKHMKSPCFKTLRSHQKINHIPGTFQIGRKDRIWRNLQSQMVRNGRKEFNFMPMTYILPQDIKRLKRLWPQYVEKDTKWIIKPPASARGSGIKVVNKWKQIPKRKPTIVQKYIDRPLLIDDSKFDLRLYVLVTSINPLRAYMHTDGLARFASVKYSNEIDTLKDRYMHLTNYSINKLSSNYAKNEDAESCTGHKWTLKTLWKYFQTRDVNTDGLWAALRNLVLRTILTGEHVIGQMTKANVNSKYNTFELFGIDVILDSELKPWLLEVNISPSLHSSSPLDLHVKGPLVTALLNTVLYNVPARFDVSEQAELMSKLGLPGHNLCFDRRLHVTNLCRGERFKHNKFTNKSIITEREQYLDAILEHLTPDDIRCLIKSEDELARCAPLERICPTSNSHRYIKFTESPRYYNHLLDAWEHRYSKKRQEGIDLLRKHCENRVHLIVPTPMPRKNNNKRTTQTQSEPKDEHTSDNEAGEVFESIAGTSKPQPQQRQPPQQQNNKILDTIETNATTKSTNAEPKSPIPLSDDQQSNDSNDDQDDILVSSIA